MQNVWLSFLQCRENGSLCRHCGESLQTQEEVGLNVILLKSAFSVLSQKETAALQAPCRFRLLRLCLLRFNQNYIADLVIRMIL